MHYEFQGLGDTEVSTYVQTLLRHAGVEDPLFTPDALQALTNLCAGSPRILDTLVEKALILGCQNKTRSLDADIVRQAHEANALYVSLPTGGASA